MNLEQEFVENCAKLCGLNPESCQDAYALSEKDARTQKRLSIEDLLVWS